VDLLTVDVHLDLEDESAVGSSKIVLPLPS
jgi:hypothetical protein